MSVARPLPGKNGLGFKCQMSHFAGLNSSSTRYFFFEPEFGFLEEDLDSDFDPESELLELDSEAFLSAAAPFL